MTDLPNGFTGFSHRDPNFVSAGDALRGSRYDDTPFAARKQAQARNLAEAWSPAGAERAGAGVAAEGGSDAVARGAGARPLSQLSSAASDVLRFAEQGTAAAGAPRFDPDKLARIPEVDRRWAWVEIDLNAIRHNASAVKQRLNPGTRLMAVVKADGYGHGAVQCAKTALNSGAEYLGVATVDEAIALREAYVNAPILILGEPPATAIPLLLAYKIMPAVYTAEFAIRYAEAADAFGVSAPFHLKVNTGMNRIGVRWDEVVEFARQISFHRALDLVGTFTHFATADCPGTIDFERQVKRFSEAVNALRAAGINPGIVHAANSAAAIRYPEVQLDMVRLGISLYGFYPCPEAYPMIDLKPAMSVKARITDVKTLPVGEGVSYGLNYRSPGAVKICTMPIGYADGFRRGLSGRTDVLLAGRRFHQVGNICMDQSMFEVNLRQRNDLDPQIGDDGDHRRESRARPRSPSTRWPRRWAPSSTRWPSASAALACRGCTYRRRCAASTKSVQQVEKQQCAASAGRGCRAQFILWHTKMPRLSAGNAIECCLSTAPPPGARPRRVPKRNSRKKDARWSTPTFR